MSREVYNPQNILTLTGVARFTPNGETGAIRLGAIVMHKMAPEIEEKTIYWPARSGLKKPARRNTTKADLVYTIDLIEHTKENDMILLFGDLGDPYTQASATNGTVTINAVQPRREYAIGKFDVSNVTVEVNTNAKVVGTQDSQGVVTPANADVILDAALGTLYVLETGTIQPADNLTVTYHCNAVTRDTIIPLDTVQREGTLFLAEFDPGSTDPIRTHEFQCVLTPKDWGQFESGGDNNKFTLQALVIATPSVTLLQ